MSQADSLSADDLRNRLYHSLRDRGLVDSLKTQLRNKLVTELRHIGVSQTFQPAVVQPSDGSLLHKAANSLVVDHLRRSNYDYTLSVFMPESGTGEDKIFTVKDLLQLLNISPESRLYRSLAAQSSNFYKKGFLWQLLCEVAAQHGNSCQTTGIQTDAVKLPPTSSLEEQLRQVDDYYSSVTDENRGRSVEERLLAYQRHIDERARTEINLEVSRFKENELARMRLEEKEKNRRELETTRKEMERLYQTKADALVDRERNSIERLQKQLEIQEKETFAQRQSILEEIEMVRQKEIDLRRQAETYQREKALLEDRVKSREELVEKREQVVKRNELEFEQRLKDQITKFKLEEQSRYLQRTTDLEYRENKAKEDQRRLDEELHEIKELKNELREKKIRNNELEIEMNKMRHDLLSAQTQAEHYGEKIREMVDYQTLKEENAVIKKELENCKMRLAELGKDNMLERQKQEELLREMSVKASKPTPEVILLQKECEKLRDQVRQEQVLAQHQLQQYQRRLQDEIDRNRELVRKYDEQNLIQKDMNRETVDLRQQLLGTRQALSHEIHRNPRAEGAIRNYDTNFAPLQDYGDNESCGDFNDPLSRHTPEQEYYLSDNGGDGDGQRTPSDDYSYSFDLVKDTKKRLKNLEREAENLEEHYRNFQVRMTSVHSILPEPVRASPNRSKVSFQEHELLRTPPRATSTVSRNTHFSHRNVSNHSSIASASRPMSSTPSRGEGPPSYPQDRSIPLLDASMSTVKSDEEENDTGRRGAVTKNRPISMADLDARPGSPSVLHVEGSGSDSGKDARRVRPPGQERSRSDQVAPPVVSLDDAWKKSSKDTDEEKRRQEEEDRAEEERRRLREEERKRKMEEAWEREQKELEELQRQESGAKVEEKKEEVAPVEEEKKEPEIDPVMQKYMAMVQEQKDKEKKKPEVAKKSVDLWQKGKQKSEDKTPSSSEQDEISKAEKSPVESDDDFEW